MNAIGYVRISDKDQSKHSISGQRREIEEYCKNNNLTLLETFEDKGETSYNFDRPDWKKVEAFVKKNKDVDYLIILDYDRFSRNLAEALLKIKNLEEKFDIKIRMTTELINIDMTDPNNYLMRSFKLMIAESELMNIRKRTRAGILQAAMGGYYTNVAPIGYTNVRTADGRPTLAIHPDPSQVKYIKDIFRMHIEGVSPENIRKELKLQGYNQRGNSQIQAIIANPTYAGLIRVPAFKDRPAYLTEGKHPAVIPQNDYWRAQGQKKTIAVQNRDEVPLRGSLHCWCGKPLTAGNSKGRSKYYWYYLCSEHRKNLPAKKLHDQFEQILENLSFSPGEAEWWRASVMDKVNEILMKKGEDVTIAKKELSILNNQITATEEKFLSNRNISEETFNKKIVELRSRKAFLEKEIKAKTATTQSYMGKITVMLPKLLNLRQAFEEMKQDKKKLFIKAIFGDTLRYTNETYRTAFINPIFSDKELVLKEKGLLLRDSPVKKMSENPLRAPERNAIEPFEELYCVFTG